MKKVLIAVMALGMLASMANASMKYECWMYKSGKPWKMLHVVADNKSEAVSKASDKFRQYNWNGDYVKCR